MSARLLASSLALSALAALAACQSSGRYGSPGYAAAAVGVAAAGAAASRAAGGCLAQCLPGSRCNRATGLCERGEVSPLPAATPATGRPGKHPPLVSTRAPYPPGHEYEVPAMSSDDAGCAPPGYADAGAIACEMDGGTI